MTFIDAANKGEVSIIELLVWSNRIWIYSTISDEIGFRAFLNCVLQLLSAAAFNSNSDFSTMSFVKLKVTEIIVAPFLTAASIISAT